jgi:hypothetical protein
VWFDVCVLLEESPFTLLSSALQANHGYWELSS